jgi:hypothetical protein
MLNGKPVGRPSLESMGRGLFTRRLPGPLEAGLGYKGNKGRKRNFRRRLGAPEEPWEGGNASEPPQKKPPSRGRLKTFRGRAVREPRRAVRI